MSKSILVVFGDIEFLSDNTAKVHTTKHTALYPENEAMELAERFIQQNKGDYIIPSQYVGTIEWVEESAKSALPPMTARQLIAMLQEEAAQEESVLDKPMYLFFDDGPIALRRDNFDFDISDRIDINTTIN